MTAPIALTRLDFVPAHWRGPIAFALRTWLTCIVALFIAYSLELDQPYWAGMSVWIVAQATPGMTLSRSLYRVLGTVVGAAMGVVLIALLSQTPELFVLALALWIGACTVASNLLRNFRSYGAVLAGYTAAIVSLAAYGNPNSIFDIAMARGAATIIGILCTSLSVYLFARHEAREKVIVHLQEVIRTFALRGAFPMTGALHDRIALEGPLIANLIALETEVEFAGAESAEFRIHADTARGLLAHLFGAISVKRSLEGHLLRTGIIQDRKTVVLHDKVMGILEYAPRQIDGDRWEDLRKDIQTIRVRLNQHLPEIIEMDVLRIASSRLVLDRLDDLLGHIALAIKSCQAIQEGWHWEPSLRLNFHRDLRTAWINGARACLAVLAAGTFWIASAWPSGSWMLIQVGVVCSLFSTRKHPDLAGVQFFHGALFAAVSAFMGNFFLLQNVDGFPLFALVLGACLVPVAIASFKPGASGFASAYCVLFVVLARPVNAMDYDVVLFLNNGMALLAGVACGVLAYRFFLPPDPRAARRYVVYRIRRGLCSISQREPIPPAWAWQTRMFDRVNRLYDAENPSGTPTEEWYEGGLDALNLGNEVLRLRLLRETANLGDEVLSLMRGVITSFASIVSTPDSPRSTIRAADAALLKTTPPEEREARLAWYRALGSLREMDAFFIEHSHFLTPA